MILFLFMMFPILFIRMDHFHFLFFLLPNFTLNFQKFVVDFFLFDFNQGLSDHLGESVFALLGPVRGGCEELLNFHFYFIIFVHLQMKFAYRFHKFFIKFFLFLRSLIRKTRAQLGVL